MTLLDIFLFVIIFMACYTDLTQMKIPNALTFPLIIGGVVYWIVSAVVTTSPEPWWFGLLGLAIAAPIHFFLWMIKLDRGGDAKLMWGVGAALGWATMLEATFWSFLAMGPVAFVVLAAQGRLGAFVATVKYAITAPFLKLRGIPIAEPPSRTYVAKAPILLVSVALARFTPWLEDIFTNAFF